LYKFLKSEFVSNISGFKDNHYEILKGVDYIVDLPDNKIETKPSRIIKFDSEGTAHIIRD